MALCVMGRSCGEKEIPLLSAVKSHVGSQTNPTECKASRARGVGVRLSWEEPAHSTNLLNHDVLTSENGPHHGEIIIYLTHLRSHISDKLASGP